MQVQRIIVTGVSRGLGKDVLKLVLQNNPEYEVIGTARSQIATLKQHFHHQFPNCKFRIMELDIFLPQSIDHFVQQLLDTDHKFDCLINNAAYGCDYGATVPTAEVAEKTLITNFLGTVALTQKLLPLLRANGRIINVSSKLGALCYHGAQVAQQYSDPNIALDWIQKQVQSYIKGCKEGNVDHYYKSAYGTSKMMLNAWSRFILAYPLPNMHRKQLKNGQSVISMSPGHCKTDMGKQHALRSCIDGALSIYGHVHGEYSSDVFYHIGVGYDFVNCGPH